LSFCSIANALKNIGRVWVVSRVSAFKRFGLAMFAVLLFAAVDLSAQNAHHPESKPKAQHPAPQGQPHSSGQPHYSAPPHTSAPPSHYPSQPKPPGELHLNEWMRQNQGLSPQEQSRKLREEPGFKQLPPQQQQQLTNRLQDLNRKPPDERERTLQRVENMERLPPERQQQIRASAARLDQLPPERQTAVRDAMRSLRNVPPGLRQSELNSQKYGQMSPEERGIVGNLLSVEPYRPPPPPPR
jgi:hypothetical protein